MLVLSRCEDESICMERDGVLVELVVVEIVGNKVRLGIEAPKETVIYRKELCQDGRPWQKRIAG